jgi:NarL family two-component system response regulator LiaR
MAYRGEGVLSPEAIQALSIRAAPQEPQYDLTSRQLEILALLAAGLSNRAIAEKLSISLSTVRFHISNILSKMGVANRAEAAARAVEDGLI